MALTDKQYQQIFRYVDEEMDADEGKAFEAAILENKELRDEVELYKQVRSLSESVEEKIVDKDQWQQVEKKSKEETWAMITEARKQWEKQYEPDLRLKNEIDAIKEKSEYQSAQKPRTAKLSSFKWLAAAVVVGVVCLSVALWFFMSKKDNSESVAQTTARDSVESSGEKVAGKPVIDSSTISDSSFLGEKMPLENLAKKSKTTKELFEQNFTPDPAPADKEGPLEDAFSSYEDKLFAKAGREFEAADLGPLTRGVEGDHQKLTTFYLHYFKALSYMAADIKTPKAISELRTAIDLSADETWKEKARWYLALAYLKDGKIESVVGLLKQIAANDGSTELKQKALALIKALDKE
jgi:hypothetical protein